MNKVIKIPCQLEAFTYRKSTQDWAITFSVQPEMLEYAKPLMSLMNESFIIATVNVKDEQEAAKELKA